MPQCYNCNARTCPLPQDGDPVGPDRVLPADNIYNVDASGRVRIDTSGPHRNACLTPISVPGLLRNAARRHPDHPALATRNPEDGTWTTTSYRDYEEAVRVCAKAFIKLGLKRYHSVCILGFNTEQWFLADLGAIYAGGFAAGIYTTNSAEACYYCADSSAANIVVVQDDKQLAKILEIKGRLPKLRAIVQYEGRPGAEGVLAWDEMMEMGRSEPDERLEEVLKTIAVNECCTLVYTSGTTGNPKAAMLTHDNLTWTSRVAAEYFGATTPAEEVVVSYLPLSHVAAQIVDIYFAISVAGTVYFGDSNALKGSLVTTLQEARPTQFLGVPRVWEKIREKMMMTGSQASPVKKAIAAWAKGVGLQHNLDRMTGVYDESWLPPVQYYLANVVVYHKVKRLLGLDRCKSVISGAAPLAPEVKKYFWSLDLPVMDVFGMSETTGCQTMNRATELKLDGIGKTLPGCLTRIGDPDADGHGEILMKGRNIFMGYLNDLPKTAETFTEDGYLRSGDVGTVDAAGYVYITGRIKEILITAGGENVCPVVIEDNIKEQLPCVSQAVLVGDKQKYLCVLLTLRCEVDLETGEPRDQMNSVARDWCRDVAGSEVESVSAVVGDREGNAAVYRELEAGIERANRKAISNAQRVQKFAVLPRDFSVVGGEFGPTMKIKRNVVLDKYADVIATLYQDT